MPLANYPARAPDNVLAAVLAVAESFGAHIKAAIGKIHRPVNLTIPAAIATVKRDCDIAVKKLKSAYDEIHSMVEGARCRSIDARHVGNLRCHYRNPGRLIRTPSGESDPADQRSSARVLLSTSTACLLSEASFVRACLINK